ncbi:MAG: NAD(P)H-hydrate dehydratase [Beijerinckiaceae bacterium]
MILTTAEIAAADAAAAGTGVPIDRLMRRAGEAVADRVAAIAGPETPIRILCGPGNNGGDGYVAARVLAARGFRVTVHADGKPRSGGAASRAAAGWIADAGADGVQPLDAFQPRAGEVIVDALYGAGLSRAIEGAEADAILRCAASGATIIAVDVPSGLDGDTGQPLGPCAPARHTVTFFRLKPAHVLRPGRALCGEITCADIGLTDDHAGPPAEPLLLNRPDVWRSKAPRLSLDTHKYRRGHCLVISGSEFQTGASRLAAIAALRAGCGAVTIAGEPDALRVHAAHLTAVMLQPVATADDIAVWLAERRPAAAVFGPASGTGADARSHLEVLLASDAPLVIDADGLTLLAAGLRPALAARGQAAVLTPHAGEFARLFPDLAADAAFAALPDRLRGSKVEQTRAAARLTGAVVVFKGPDSVVAAPDGRAAVNVNAGPELATAGSGDVLAGIVGAHLAQGMPPFEAAAAGVWLHAETGRRLGLGLTADDLAAAMRPLATLPLAPAAEEGGAT